MLIHTNDTPVYGVPDDTIAAISSAHGNAAISVIRISGADSLPLIKSISRPKNDSKCYFKNRHATLTSIYDTSTHTFLDQAIVIFYRGPESYTGEDMVEVFCHGGSLITKEILSLMVKHGARIAFPGEFTYRSFCNNKMDLTQAESVQNIINARNRSFLHVSTRQLEGALGRNIFKLREKLVKLLASIEVVIEYPEEDTPQISKSFIKQTVNDAVNDLELMIQNADSSDCLNESVKITIIGKPNAGKSSIMNRLLKKERVIVNDTPGTTRDTISDLILHEEYEFLITDTAGITETSDQIESEGIQRSIQSTIDVDMIFVVFDVSTDLDKNDEKVIELVRDNENVIYVLNKDDLNSKISCDDIKMRTSSDIKCLYVSAMFGTGFDTLIESMIRIAENCRLSGSDYYIISNRSRKCLGKALNHLQDCLSNADNVPDDILSIDIRSAADSLAEITGQITTDDILSEIFSSFCVGK